MSESISSSELISFISDLFEFDDKPSSLIAMPSARESAWVDRIPSKHDVVCVSEHVSSERRDNRILVGRPFYRSIPFSADFYLAVGKSEIIEAPMLQLQSARFGPFGPSSRADAEPALIETCLSGARRFACVVVPRRFIVGDAFAKVRAWVRASSAAEAIRVSIDSGVIDGFNEHMMLMAWHVGQSSKRDKPVWMRVQEPSEFDDVIAEWRKSNWRSALFDEYKRIKVTGKCPLPNNFMRDEPDFRVEFRSRETPPSLEKVRVCVDGNGGSLRLVAEDDASLASLRAAKRMLGTKRDQVSKQRVPTLDFRLRARWLVRQDNGLDQIVDTLEGFGFRVEISDDVEGWVDSIKRRYRRERVPFEQNIQADGKWERLHEDRGVESELEQLFWSNLRRIDEDLPWPLWNFQKKDLARMLCKPSSIYAAFMGAGKTRLSMSYVWMRGGRRNLVVLQSRLIDEFLAEAKKIGFPLDDIHVIEEIEDAKPENLKRLNLISYSRVWKQVGTRVRPLPSDAPKSAKPDACKTIAHVLRKTRFNSLVFDEAHYLKGGPSTKQARYSMLFRAKHVLLMSGTVARNYPRNLYPLLVRTFGSSSTSCQWAYDIPVEHPTKLDSCTSGTRVFSDKFVETTYVSAQFESTLEGPKGRELPKVPDDALEDWYSMLEHKVLRRQRKEPDVLKDIPLPEADEQDVEFEIDRKHAEFYLWWLESFFEWMETELAKEKSSRGSYSMSNGAILAQLQKLQFAATIPQSPKVNEGVPVKWPGGLTTKQAGVVDSVTEAVIAGGEKIIVFSKRPELLDLLDEEFYDRGVASVVFHGGVTISKRNEKLKEFRSPDGPDVLLMSLGSGNTGYNIPEADAVWLCDYDWVPSTMKQAAARMLRSDWLTEERKESGAQPKIRQAVQMGTIDEYMRQLVNLKMDGLDQALDRQDAEFDPDKWMTYRDFSVKMFRDLGFDL